MKQEIKCFKLGNMRDFVLLAKFMMTVKNTHVIYDCRMEWCTGVYHNNKPMTIADHNQLAEQAADHNLKNNNTLTYICGIHDNNIESAFFSPQDEQYLSHDQVSFKMYSAMIDNLRFFNSYMLFAYGGGYMHKITDNGNKFPMQQSNKHRFVCRNRNPHVHRALLLDYLAKYELIEDNAITWVLPDLYSQTTVQMHKFKYFDNRRLTCEDDPINQSNDWSDSYPKFYDDAIFDIVTESNMVPFYTEKTTMPLLFEKPFLVSGFNGANQRLRDHYGFKLYDDIVDYGFDQASSLEEHAELLALEMKRLTGIDKQELIDKTRDTARYNLGRFLYIHNYEFADMVPPELLLDNGFDPTKCPAMTSVIENSEYLQMVLREHLEKYHPHKLQ